MGYEVDEMCTGGKEYSEIKKGIIDPLTKLRGFFVAYRDQMNKVVLVHSTDERFNSIVRKRLKRRGIENVFTTTNCKKADKIIEDNNILAIASHNENECHGYPHVRAEGDPDKTVKEIFGILSSHSLEMAEV